MHVSEQLAALFEECAHDKNQVAVELKINPGFSLFNNSILTIFNQDDFTVLYTPITIKSALTGQASLCLSFDKMSGEVVSGSAFGQVNLDGKPHWYNLNDVKDDKKLPLLFDALARVSDSVLHVPTRPMARLVGGMRYQVSMAYANNMP